MITEKDARVRMAELRAVMEDALEDRDAEGYRAAGSEHESLERHIRQLLTPAGPPQEVTG